MSKRFAATLFASMTLLFSPADAAAADRVQPGHWESKMTMAPSAKPMAVKYCITPAEAALMNGDLPVLRKYLVDSTKASMKGRCAVKSVEIKGNNRTVVALTCGKSEVVNTTTYHGDRYESLSSNGAIVSGNEAER